MNEKTSWDSVQYQKYANERTQPAIDLLSRVQNRNPVRILDVGCGNGNSTEILFSRYPNADIIGIDSSENMIEAAKTRLPDVRFELLDASTELHTLGGDFDIIFANASLQWIPNHPEILAQLIDMLSDGGTLAVQMPDNHSADVHRIARELVSSSQWNDKLDKVRPFHNLTPEEYFELLSDYCVYFDIWTTTYYHVMSTHSAILEWYKGAGIRPYIDELDSDNADKFENDVLEKITKAFPAQKNGKILLPFPRLFFTATK